MLEQVDKEKSGRRTVPPSRRTMRKESGMNKDPPIRRTTRKESGMKEDPPIRRTMRKESGMNEDPPIRRTMRKESGMNEDPPSRRTTTKRSHMHEDSSNVMSTPEQIAELAMRDEEGEGRKYEVRFHSISYPEVPAEKNDPCKDKIKSDSLGIQTPSSLTIHNYSISREPSLMELPKQTTPILISSSEKSENLELSEKPCKQVTRTRQTIYKKPVAGKKELLTLKYFKNHKLMEFLGFLMRHIVVNKPDNVKEFLINLLDECVLFRAGVSGNPPLLFKDQHLLSLYTSLDPGGFGYITEKQYIVAMSTLGINEYPPIDSDDDKLSSFGSRSRKVLKQIFKEDFLRIAKLCLVEQLLDLISVPTPSEDLTEVTEYTVREEEITPSPSPTIVTQKISLTPQEGDLMKLDRYKRKKVWKTEAIGITEDEATIYGEVEVSEEGDIEEPKIIVPKKDKKKLIYGKPEMLKLAEHPHLQVMIYQHQPLVKDFVELYKKELDYTQMPTDSKQLIGENYGEYFNTVQPPVMVEPKTLSEEEVKSEKYHPVRRPLISGKSRNWNKPNDHFWKIMERIKRESRRKLTAALDFLKEKPKEEVVEEEEVKEDEAEEIEFEEEEEESEEEEKGQTVRISDHQ